MLIDILIPAINDIYFYLLMTLCDYNIIASIEFYENRVEKYSIYIYKLQYKKQINKPDYRINILIVYILKRDNANRLLKLPKIVFVFYKMNQPKIVINKLTY